MKNILSIVPAIAMTLALVAYSGNKTKKATQEDKKPNVLLIAVDDLNDWIGVLGGHPQVKTPNIDALAREGIVFEQAFSCCPVKENLVAL